MDDVFVEVERVDEAQAEANDADNLALLDETERARYAQFLFERDRWTYAAAHALLRRSLTRYMGHTEPGAWQFERDEHGKPRVRGAFRPAFSLSHARGCVGCAVAAPGVVLGLDVERVVARPTPDDVLAKFAAPERAQVNACAPALRDRSFYELWVLKEAYLKARGVGLGVPLDSFWFTRESTENIAISFADAHADSQARWHFEVHSVGDEHVFAVAVAALAPRIKRSNGRQP